MKYWWPTLVWAGLIFWLSSRPTALTSEIYWRDFVVKKTAHLLEYALLAVLLYRSLKHTSQFDRVSRLAVALMLTVLYALSDEFHQSFIPGREGRFRDVVVDTVGAGVGLWLIDKRGIITA